MASSDPRGLAKEVGTLRRLRPNLKNAVSHLVLSHDPSQRKLSESEWRQAIEVALEEHGATGAAMASWLHFDAQHQHAHVFFCRVLPNGEVVSDSHNFRKNETAARRIENLMNLQPPTPLPADEQIGDRQAVTNARRRAERNGTLDPSKIDVKAVRAALAEARDHAHFLQLLAEANIETGIDRRGVGRQIFGWRLRRIGAQEWIKASTLAKDLSWPKIAHRFPELAESQAQAPAPPTVEAPAPAAPVQAKPDQYTRAPAPIRQLLREQEQDRQLRREMASVPTLNPEPAKQPSKRWGVDLAAVDRSTRDLGPLTRAMALLGAVAIKYSLAFLRGLIAWLGRLLSKLGFGIKEMPQHVAGVQQAVTFEPFTIDAEAHQVPDVEAAAQLVNQVATALEEKNAAWLPRGEGRDAIAAGLMADTGRDPEPVTVVAEGAEKNVLDDMFSVEVTEAAAPAPEALEAAPAAPAKSAWLVFQEAAKAFSQAAAAVQQARLKPIMYIDGRPKARALHQAAAAELRELERAHAGWRADHKVAAALGADPLGLKAQVEAARTAAARTSAGLLKADQEHAEFEILFAKTPAPTVPMALQDRHAAAAVTLNKAKELLISKARLNLNILDGNPMLRQRREALAAQVRRAETRMAAFLVDPRSQPAAVAELEQTLRALAAEVNIERARLAPRPDVDEAQNVDEAGQHGHAVPGQR